MSEEMEGFARQVHERDVPGCVLQKNRASQVLHQSPGKNETF